MNFILDIDDTKPKIGQQVLYTIHETGERNRVGTKFRPI